MFIPEQANMLVSYNSEKLDIIYPNKKFIFSQVINYFDKIGYIYDKHSFACNDCIEETCRISFFDY